MLKTAFENSGSIQQQFGQMFASKVISRLLEEVEDDPVHDLNKLAFD